MTSIKQRGGGGFSGIDWKHYFSTLRYSLYTCRRPLDGFWDLIHEKRGSLAAAHTILFLGVVVEIMRQMLSNFQFVNVNMEAFSAGMVVMQQILPIVLFAVANWCLTTLFDGKGRISDIYMGYAYAMAPQIIITAALIPVSHIITYDEGALYFMFTSIGWIWFVFLMLCAMKQIHDYSFGKAVLTTILTLLAIGIMVFIFLMFFAVVSDGIAYFWAVGQEIMFRIQRG